MKMFAAVLQYFATGQVTDPFTAQMDELVDQYNKSERKWVAGVWTWEKEFKYRERLAREDGEAAGVARGLAQGEALQREALAKLAKILIAENRIDDLVRANTDFEYQSRLLKQYGLLPTEKEQLAAR
jgi:hypothetical protein